MQSTFSRCSGAFLGLALLLGGVTLATANSAHADTASCRTSLNKALQTNEAADAADADNDPGLAQGFNAQTSTALALATTDCAGQPETVTTYLALGDVANNAAAAANAAHDVQTARERQSAVKTYLDTALQSVPQLPTDPPPVQGCEPGPGAAAPVDQPPMTV